MVSIRSIKDIFSGKGDSETTEKDISGLEKRDILLDIFWASKKIKTTRRLNIFVFLLQEKCSEIKQILNYTFYDTIRGPYSPELMDDIDVLATGWINGDDKVTKGEGFGYSYELSDFGITDFKFHRHIREKLKRSGIEYKIKEFIEDKKYDILNKGHNELVRDIKKDENYKNCIEQEKNLLLFRDLRELV
ncbi:MAG: hypothetical protein CVT89_02290 [Candidatus Altiarchaeales archaeon HGW-Altiarchaeales-2]|nr:MAG: hypothetical protein CVT89_02290 [Candidatus Altiarchaeales archaeon HGW-Altiarchaeales-2]